MLDIKFIRENPDLIKKNCRDRLVNVDIDELLRIDERRRQLEAETDNLRAERNAASKSKPTPETITAMKNVGEKIKINEDELAVVNEQYRNLLLTIPNLTHPDVLVSDDEDDNPEISRFMEPTRFDFEPKDHVQLAEELDLIDFERATKVSGAKFYYLKNELVILELALIQYALSVVAKRGFTAFATPDLAKKKILEELGFNPRSDSTNIYSVADTDLCLIGTAEITMGGYHMDEVLDEDKLPLKYAAVSHCYRTEAGSYSKYSKGIFRVHQFSKVEMFQYVLPSESEIAHMEMLDIEKEIFEGLKIPFRVVDHCTADLGGPSIRTYDLEAWMPGKPAKDGTLGDWGEITSTSNCTDYQARGLNIKYKDADGKKYYVHMLNGTAISLARAMISIMENYQQSDGSIMIPEIIRPYMGGMEKISSKKDHKK